MKEFALEMIVRALRDWHLLRGARQRWLTEGGGTMIFRDELETFFSSEWFETLCELAGIEPDVVRRKLQIG